MKAQLQMDKTQIHDLLSYALKEYGSMTLMKTELMRDGFITESFGTYSAKISMVMAEKNRLYLRKYDVSDSNGEIVLCFILGHAAMLFGNSARGFREDLVSTERIKGVATLKQSVFEHIVMPAAVIILGGDEDTWFTTADSIDSLVDIMNGEFYDCAKVYYSNNINPDNLLPEFYNGEEQEIEDSFKGSTTKELAEVATVIAGKGARRDEYSDVGIPYLRARDIKNGKIQEAEVYIAQENVVTFSRQLIQEGDILLTKNFGQNKLALVTENDLPAIASNALFIIRPFEVSEGYLYRYLTSETGNAIFNKQINRIQKGITIPSVALADLVHVKVPVFDDETMENLSNIELISKEEAIETTKKLLGNASSGSHLEESVKEALIAAGWDEEKLLQESNFWIEIGNNKRWQPDFLYELADGCKVIIEVKSDLLMIRPDWIQVVNHILQAGENYIFILSTGMYYEVHISGIDKSLQLMKAPTIEQILDWQKEVR